MKKTPSQAKELTAFVKAIENKTRREDAQRLIELFEKTTGQPPKLWPPSIIGFGEYHYKYESGREGDSINVGFSPTKEQPCVVRHGLCRCRSSTDVKAGETQNRQSLSLHQ